MGGVQHAKKHSIFDLKHHMGGYRLERTIGDTGYDYIELGSFQQDQGSFILLISTAIIEATSVSSADFYIITGDYNQTANVWNLVYPMNHTDLTMQIIAKINNDVLSLRLMMIASSIIGPLETITSIIDMSTGDTVFTPATGTGSMTGIVPTTVFPTTLLSQYLGTIWAYGNLNMGGNLVNNAGDPVANQDLTTKIWVLAEILSAFQDWVSKDNVDAATTGALPANTRTGDVLTASANGAFPTIDGVAAGLNKDYLVKDEGGVASHINDGIYTLTQLGDVSNPWKLTRRADLDDGDSAAGSYLAVEAGTLNGDKTFRCVNNAGTDVVNTDALEFLYWGETIDHANLLNVLADQHHDKSHAHDGLDGSGTVAHSDTTGQTTNDHHARPIQATETVLGIAELATQAETDAGTDDLKIVTPLKLASYPGLGVPSGTSFPGTPSDGDLFNRTDLDMVFRYDATRVKWLSEHSEMLSCGRGPVSDVVDAYCGVANAPMSSTSGFRMPRNGTIIAVTIENQNTVTRTIDCRVNNSLVNRVQVVLTAAKGGKVINANQDFSADNLLQALALIAAGNTMTNLIITIEVKWRA